MNRSKLPARPATKQGHLSEPHKELIRILARKAVNDFQAKQQHKKAS